MSSTRGSSRPNVLATANLDRMSHVRKDEAWVAERWSSGQSSVHLIWRGHVASIGSDAAGIKATAAHALVEGHAVPILLGSLDDRAHFAIDVSHLERHAVEDVLHEDAMLTNLREVAGVLSADAANLLATASGITTWHAKHRFCGSCGAPTEVRSAGHERHCPACNADHFPRTDSAVIMLVTNGDKAVLGRQKIWPPGMFSTLAGFLEPGESLEDTVRREVFEEVGVVVDEVRYNSSQPWPFPSSLMLGFHATTSQTDLKVDPNELETAEWFEREQLAEARTLGRRGYPMVPPPMTIARRLLDDWLDA